MHSKTKLLGVAVFFVAAVSLSLVTGVHSSISASSASEQPSPIREGPLTVANAGGGGPFWFQQGAFSDSSTYNSVGASVAIKTVYDTVNSDAHSYWVGSILSNSAFVQVGYLNGPTTTGGFYCCAWFYEFFPPNNSTSPPIIGPAGSAGPIGSWHTYTLNTTGSGVWSFYMDNQYLGSSPPAGNQWNLGSSNTGNNPVAALSEVADTTGRSDMIGPAEFKNLEYAPSNPNAFQAVQTGHVHIGCGQSPTSCLPNPYGVAEVENTADDFLAGSVIAPGPDECGNPTTTVLWSVTLGLSCTGSSFSFSFVDMDGNSITPSWISLIDSSNTEIFYTAYQSQTLPSPSGQWTINQVSWHSVNVAKGEAVNPSATSPFLVNVFSIRLNVIGYIYSIPVKNATVIAYLPDSTNQTVKTDANGRAVISQIPPGAYSFHISVPYGIPSNQVHNISGPGSVVAKVFSLPDLLTIVVPPILLAIVASAVVARRERRRQAMIQAQTPGLYTGPVVCRTCGHPLAPTANFCTSCGTPVRMTA